MEPHAHAEVLRSSARALLDAAAGHLDLPVRGCPDWSVAELVVHVGQVWGWSAAIVATGARAERPEPPADRSERVLLGWAQERAERLSDALDAADADASCWTFGMPRTARFWFRRQAMETVLHAWDVQGAAGAPAPIPPDVAADGLDEHLAVIVPRTVRGRPEPWTGQTVHLHRTDGDDDGDGDGGGGGDDGDGGGGGGEWTLRLGPAGEVATERAHKRADLGLRGPAAALWLWVANRASPDTPGVEVFGDAALAERWAAEMVF